MKKKNIHISRLFLIALVLASLFILLNGIYNTKTIHDGTIENAKYQLPQEEYEARQIYRKYYRPKIDSLLKVDNIKAIEFIDSTMKVYPNKSLLEFDKGNAYFQLDSFKRAIKHYQLSKGESGFYLASGHIGWSYFELGEYDKSISEFETAAKTDKSYYYNIASIYEEIGQSDKAIKYYKLILEKLKINDLIRDKKEIDDLERKIAKEK